jgi:hypothetical protein
MLKRSSEEVFRRKRTSCNAAVNVIGRASLVYLKKEKKKRRRKRRKK